MAGDSNGRTSLSLLQRLYDGDEGAWQRFLKEYGPRILAWCRHWHLQDADADDVTGIVLLKLSQCMCRFEYDPAHRFRGWLHTVVNGEVKDFLETRSRRLSTVGSGDSGIQEALEQAPNYRATDDLKRELEEMLDPEIVEAMSAVQARVKPHTWAAFHLTTVEGAKATEVASRLGISIALVHTARCRVAKMLQEEVRQRLHPNTQPA